MAFIFPPLQSTTSSISIAAPIKLQLPASFCFQSFQSVPLFHAHRFELITNSKLQFVWLYYFGSQTTNGHAYAASSSVGGAYANGPSTGASRNVGGFNQYGSKDNSYNNQAYNTGGRLHGLETSSPEIRYPDAPSNPRMSPSPQNGVRGFGPAPTSPQHANNPYRSSVAQTGTGTGPASTMADESVSAPTEYPYRARAIYSYDANPDDANEISFAKHEILEISDVSGRWWQARKQNGDTGIAPSNYLILL